VLCLYFVLYNKHVNDDDDVCVHSSSRRLCRKSTQDIRAMIQSVIKHSIDEKKNKNNNNTSSSSSTTTTTATTSNNNTNNNNNNNNTNNNSNNNNNNNNNINNHMDVLSLLSMDGKLGDLQILFYPSLMDTSPTLNVCVCVWCVWCVVCVCV